MSNNQAHTRMSTRSSSTTTLKGAIYDENVAPVVAGVFGKSLKNIQTTQKNLPLNPANFAKRTTLGDISNVSALQNASEAKKSNVTKVEPAKSSFLQIRRAPISKPIALPLKVTSNLTQLDKPKPTTSNLGITGNGFTNLHGKFENIQQKQYSDDEDEEDLNESSDVDSVQQENMSATSGVTNIDVDSMEIEAQSNQRTSQNVFVNAEIDDVEDIDMYDHDDPQFCTDYVEHIFEYLRKKEVKDAVNPNYMEKQIDMAEKHRTVLIDWMAEVCVKFKLLTETLFLSISILDRFLEVKAVAREKLQLVGITAMLLASKYEEMYTPEVRDFIWITAKAYTKEEVLKMERLILVTLDFNLATPSPLHFLRRFSKAARSNVKIHTLSKYITELSLLEYGLLKFLPSVIAASAVYISRRMCQISPPWNSTLEYHTNYRLQEILPCVHLLNSLIKKQETSKFKAIFKKYSSAKLLSVAEIPVCLDL